MELIFHGGAKEVGRSCIELQTKGDRYLLDAGVKFQEDGLGYPKDVFEHEELDGLFLSHAHLDHSGALPFFEHKDMVCPIITTSQTKVITRILLRDSYKVARIKNIHPAYSRKDIRKVWDSFKLVNWNNEYHHRELTYELYNAGHIPGSACYKISDGDHTILYTGDLNTRETRLMHGAFEDYEEDIDLLICESTYGSKELPSREEEEERFKQAIRKTLDRDGRVLIPVFALGRAQEVLILLSQEDYDVPIYFDGMCKRITKKILNNPSSYVNNKDALADEFFNRVTLVKSNDQRDQIIENKGIFVTTSGMLQGGPIMHYLKEMWGDESSSVLITGFQAKNTNGRNLLEDGYVYMDGWKTYVQCHVDKFEFSAHLSREDIKDFVRQVDPEKVAFVHGEPEGVENMVKWAEKETSIEAYGPEIGDRIMLG